MTLYYGICRNEQCRFNYSVEGRFPNYCPECGAKLFDTIEELQAAKNCFRLLDETNID